MLFRNYWQNIVMSHTGSVLFFQDLETIIHIVVLLSCFLSSVTEGRPLCVCVCVYIYIYLLLCMYCLILSAWFVYKMNSFFCLRVVWQQTEKETTNTSLLLTKSSTQKVLKARSLRRFANLYRYHFENYFKQKRRGVLLILEFMK